MAAEPENDPTAEDPEAKASRVGAYDLDGDGKVSPIEDARARLGVIDAELEQTAEEGGIKGKIAGAAHHIVDKFDND
jgi:hypothetical protein